MRSLHRFFAAVVLFVLAMGVSCGGAGEQKVISPTGGELCLGDRKICIMVPPRGLANSVTLRASQGSDSPPAALSEAFDISASDGKPVQFLVPATVSIKLALVDANNVPNDTLLRVYTRDPETNEWVALGSPLVDRLRGEITGTTMHLSPFVVLRADRLPDGSFPEEIDASVRDSGVIAIPPVPDAGRLDAGRPPANDAGRADAGGPGPLDAGQTPTDAGQMQIDAGTTLVDAGLAPVDAGAPFDAGAERDAGAPDAGELDAGEPDAGS